MTWLVKPGGALRGEVRVPGDKSVTHRAYLFSALARGTCRIVEPLRAQDTDSTLAAIMSLGVVVEDRKEEVIATSRGIDSLTEPGNVIDLGNSGTGARLITGLVSGCPFHTVLTGDGSLRQRPMARVVEPVRMMGAAIDGRANGTLLPLSIRGGHLRGIDYTSPVASAQVKSCILIAALNAQGTTVFTEPALSRDHTERMLGSMGIAICREGHTLAVEGGQTPNPVTVIVPGDISSAAFLLAAATVVEGSELTVRGVGVNPTRTGILRLIEAMGGKLEVTLTEEMGEPIADITVEGTGELKGISVPQEWIPAIIDELPIAAVLAAVARGVTEIRGAAELRVKESDRISTTVNMLDRAGVRVEELEDGFRVHGPSSIRSAQHPSHGDHRIAMSASILSLLADDPSKIVDTDCVDTSFPGYVGLMNGLLPGSISTA